MIIISKKLFISIAALITLAALLTGCAGAPAQTAAPVQSAAPVQTASEAPAGMAVEFDTIDLSGNQISQSIIAEAELTMLNIWATYCGPCLNEMPDLGELAAEYEAGTVQIIGVVSDAVDEITLGTAISAVAATGAGYTHLLPTESLYNEFLTDVYAVPTTLFLDRNGNVLEKVIGSKSKDDWKAKIDELYAEVSGK